MLHAEWLPIVLQGSFSEIYILDAATLRLTQTNQAARRNLRYSARELSAMHLPDLATGSGSAALQHAIDRLRSGRNKQARFETVQRRKDGTTYPIEFRLFYAAAPSPVFIAIGNDVTARHASADALQQSDARVRAIVGNTPGLVYQFRREADGSVSFPYLSKGCRALLGVSAEQLRRDSSLFLKLILPEDRSAYLDSMQQSATSMQAWNWEGRIWIETWKDIKWINLRSTPRAIANGGVQWEGIMTNITQSRREQAEIRQSRAQLAELSAHIQNVKEQERTRIAREIHDDLGGNLTAIKMALALLTRRLPADAALLLEKANYVDTLIDRSIEAVHRIAGDLRPGVLDFGLVEAIGWQAAEFEKQTSVPCEFVTNPTEPDLDADKATALFRIFQEALTNIAKHAQATRVAVRLTHNSHNLQLEVEDNGKGIAPSDRIKPKSFGIRGMMERALALGGNLVVDAPAGGGCIVTIRIPLQRD